MNLVKLHRSALLAGLALLASPGLAVGTSTLPFDNPGLVLDAASDVRDLAVGDFDGDGAEDLAVWRSNGLTVQFGDGTGRAFEASTSIPGSGSGVRIVSLGDVDGQPGDELGVSGGKVYRFLPDRSAQVLLTVSGAVEFTSGDFDDDGDLDIASGTYSSVTIHRNDFGLVFTDVGLLGMRLSSAHTSDQLVAGDFDGNGQTDLAARAGPVTGGLRAYLFSDPDLTQPTIIDHALPFHSGGMTGGDLDGDGRTDIVSMRFDNVESNAGPIGLDLMRSLGAGGFENAGFIPTIGSPQHLGIGDVDGDGILDLQTVEPTSDESSWYRGTGGFAFEAAARRPAGGAGRAIAWMDVDLDGKKDVVLGASTGIGVVAYRILPPFEEDGGTMATGNAPRMSASGDLDGDGRQDFAVAHAGAGFLSLYRQEVGGTAWSRSDLPLDTPAHSILVGDFDADGLADLATTHTGVPVRVELRWGQGGGVFGAPQTIALPGGESFLRARDLNGDGLPDLVAVSPVASAVRPLLSAGARVYVAGADIATPTTTADLVVQDVTGDAIADLVASDPNTLSIRIHPGLLGGGYASPVIVPVAGGVQGFAVLDADADGHFDLVVARTSGGAVLLRGTAGGSFGAPEVISNASSVRTVRSADFDGDGDLDLALLAHGGVQDDGIGSVHVLHGDGGGSFLPAGSFATRRGPSSLELGEVTGDGRLDLLVTHREDANVRVYTNRATGPGIVSVPALPAGRIALRAWPSPARGGLTVEVSGAPEGRAELALHDLSGRRRAGPWTVELGSEGRARIRPEVSLGAGVYYFRVVSGAATGATRVVLLD